MKTLQNVWDNCLSYLKEIINNEQSFSTWFLPIVPVKLENKTITIQVPSQFFYEWLEEHYADKINKSIKSELGPDAKFEYMIMVDKGGQKNGQPLFTNATGGNKHLDDEEFRNGFEGNALVIPGIVSQIKLDSQLNPAYTFRNFIEGDCNLLARSAGFAIAKKPGAAYNPMVIYGDSGLGKTHLAHAIGNELKIQHPNKKVLFINADAYISQFIEALKSGKANQYSNIYLNIDVLIVDDIQFFANKEKTQEHFFHTFNSLHQSGKQLILTSDVPPRDLPGINDRLLSRFKWGLAVELQIPDLETRIAILERKAQMEGIEIPRDVSAYVAHHINDSIRTMEGVLNHLLAQSLLMNREIDLNMAKESVRNVSNHVSSEITCEFITKTISEHYRIPMEGIKGNSRKRELVIPRQVAMYLCRTFTNKSLTEIGKFFNRDHTTVMHAVNTVNDQKSMNSLFKDEVEEFSKKIKLSE
ncbi:MAG: chromosomal replication initiator protein DnaA [Sphingobacteriales bacterium]|nr:MAG: chromosomal replication initiator protein DnaA [Sphingobacteriales bacterium]